MNVKYVLDTKFDTFCSKNQIKGQPINTWRSNHSILKYFISNFSSTRSRTFLLLRCSRPIDVRSLLLTFYCFYSLYTICLSIFLFHWRCQTLLLTLAFDGTACCHFEWGLFISPTLTRHYPHFTLGSPTDSHRNHFLFTTECIHWKC